jgi:hypothetical protein
MVGTGCREEAEVVFVWSDELALLLRDEGIASPRQLSRWITSPVAYRLADGEDPLTLGLRLFAEEPAAVARKAS